MATERGSDIGWRLCFLAGLLAAPLLLWAVAGIGKPSALQTSPMLLITAGLLVGYGTRLGSGCTSGHGVCGLARLSFRSLIATGLFMASGAAVVFVVRHLLGA
ncbi:YeeE/YedE family protein [Skermanella pratensis]|uniref:YeeE/YedE family protein n=1 Tax=Skermanella pratensis TaxID=2233999 RepID=UPI0031B64DCE